MELKTKSILLHNPYNPVALASTRTKTRMKTRKCPVSRKKQKVLQQQTMTHQQKSASAAEGDSSTESASSSEGDSATEISSKYKEARTRRKTEKRAVSRRMYGETKL